MPKPFYSLSLSLENYSILKRIKEGYLLWLAIVPHMAKSSRYTIGSRIENRFLDLMEFSYDTYFTAINEKKEKISRCIKDLDKLKYLLSLAWEAKLISNKQYEAVALKLYEAGRMLGGWKNNLSNPKKKNRTL
ncbi:four helix bundle protein [Patescibacteria group bacterium]|nr:four helix bundle protein [Patescibacteria group bacterium]